MRARERTLIALALQFDVDRVVDEPGWTASLTTLVAGACAEHTGDGEVLVALPEHTGLLAMLLGARGAAARDALAADAPAGTVLEALAVGYLDVLETTAARFPTVSAPGALLQLALTDTLVRGVVDAVAGIAASAGVWVSVGTTLADWRAVGPARGWAGEPEATGGYLATGPDVRNRNLVFDPAGRLVAVQDKVSLVEMEATVLALQAAPLIDVEVADLAVGRVASVISKDAWMPDVNDRLDQLGAELMLQPEAFEHWADPARHLDEHTGARTIDLWPPDKLQRGGWWMLRRHRAMVANLTPVLRGRVLGVGFDGQPLVATAAPGDGPARGLLGQPAAVGWAAVGPWRGRPAADLLGDERRTALAALDHAGGPDSDSWAVARVTLSPTLTSPAGTLPPPAAGERRSVDTGETGEAIALVPDLAGRNGQRWLTWIRADADGRQQVLARCLDDDQGILPVATLPPVGAAAVPAGTAEQRWWRPRVALGEHGPVVAVLGFGLGCWDLYAAVPDGPGPTRIDDAEVLPGTMRERGHDAPVLRATPDGLVAVWSDLRWPWVLPQVRVARSQDGGRSWGASRRVDGGPAAVADHEPLAGRAPGESAGQTAPAVAVLPDGVVVIAWQELAADGRTAIRVVRLDGTRPLGPPCWLQRDAAAAARPAVVVLAGAVVVVAERDAPDGGAAVVAWTSTDGGISFTGPRVLDASRPAGAVQRNAVVAAAPTSAGSARPGSVPAAVVVFEDDRAGRWRVLALGLAADGTPTVLRRVDDASADGDALAPTVLVDEVGTAVVWQDRRNGREVLRLASIELAADPRPEG